MSDMTSPVLLEKGVFDMPLFLSKSLEPQRNNLRRQVIDAQGRLRDFAYRHGWGHFMDQSFAERAEIYENQKEFIQALFRTTGADPSTELPDTVSAALEENILMAVSPEVYDRIYPQGREERSFEKLIAHEMAHRLHIRILHGDEAAMGPMWFFEGFAIYAAGQFEDATIQPDEVWEVVQQKQRGRYRTYGATIRFFLTRASLTTMVDRANDENFLDWLREHAF
jgi:hypothetical protein